VDIPEFEQSEHPIEEQMTINLSNGLKIDVTVFITEDGPLLDFHGANCRLDGIAPGQYMVVPVSTSVEAGA